MVTWPWVLTLCSVATATSCICISKIIGYFKGSSFEVVPQQLAYQMATARFRHWWSRRSSVLLCRHGIVKLTLPDSFELSSYMLWTSLVFLHIKVYIVVYLWIQFESPVDPHWYEMVDIYMGIRQVWGVGVKHNTSSWTGFWKVVEFGASYQINDFVWNGGILLWEIDLPVMFILRKKLLITTTLPI